MTYTHNPVLSEEIRDTLILGTTTPKEAAEKVRQWYENRFVTGQFGAGSIHRMPPDLPTIETLLQLGYVKGCRVRDWMGNEGVITDDSEWHRGVYSYVIMFMRPDGQEVYLTNGIIFATKLS